MNAVDSEFAEQLAASSPISGNDVGSLFSHFGPFSGNATAYRELVREEAALNAVHRWPLLAEIQGIDNEASQS